MPKLFFERKSNKIGLTEKIVLLKKKIDALLYVCTQLPSKSQASSVTVTNVLDICLPFLKYLYRCLLRWLTYSGINNGTCYEQLSICWFKFTWKGCFLSWLNEPTTNRRLLFFSASITHPNLKILHLTFHIDALLFVCTRNLPSIFEASQC